MRDDIPLENLENQKYLRITTLNTNVYENIISEYKKYLTHYDPELLLTSDQKLFSQLYQKYVRMINDQGEGKSVVKPEDMVLILQKSRMT
jgi:hypothetical protein